MDLMEGYMIIEGFLSLEDKQRKTKMIKELHRKVLLQHAYFLHYVANFACTTKPITYNFTTLICQALKCYVYLTMTSVSQSFIR